MSELGKIQVTPSMMRKNEATIAVQVRVTYHWRVWLGLRLIWLGARIAGMGYKAEDGEK